MTRILGVIPARYASTRFPAKALADVGGKPMIQRVYEQAAKTKSLNTIVVATDHKEIYTCVHRFCGEACMTKESHVSGTDRCYEALQLQKQKFDYVINIQGDEPFIHPDQIDLLATAFDGKTEIATLVKRIEKSDQLFSPNVVKVVISGTHEALYFSRAAIPHIRNAEQNNWINSFSFYKHIGMYGYRVDVLKELTNLDISTLEQSESLEQLRWLENGYKIKVLETKKETIGIDTPDDLKSALTFLQNQ